MTESIVAGIAIGRRGGAVMRAKVLPSPMGDNDIDALKNWPFEPASTWPSVELLDFEEWKWSGHDPMEAQHYVREVCKLIGRTGKSLTSVAVSANGPFESLERVHHGYGVLSEWADSPLSGIDLKPLLMQEFGDGVTISFQTDANACALGEAHTTNLPYNETLAFLYVAEGIGLGVVTGRRIHHSALHPEMGLLPVRYLESDLLKPKNISNEYGGSLAYLATDIAMRKRVQEGVDIETDATNDEIWNQRAYYLMQAVVACTSILAPHRVVLGTQLEERRKYGATVKRVRDRFEAYLEVKRLEDAPLIEYGALNNLKRYIVGSRLPEAVLHGQRPLHINAALGMCVYAARTAQGRS